MSDWLMMMDTSLIHLPHHHHFHSFVIKPWEGSQHTSFTSKMTQGPYRVQQNPYSIHYFWVRSAIRGNSFFARHFYLEIRQPHLSHPPVDGQNDVLDATNMFTSMSVFCKELSMGHDLSTGSQGASLGHKVKENLHINNYELCTPCMIANLVTISLK